MLSVQANKHADGVHQHIVTQIKSRPSLSVQLTRKVFISSCVIVSSVDNYTVVKAAADMAQLVEKKEGVPHA